MDGRRRFAPERAAQGIHRRPQRRGTTRELAEKVRDNPVERASDPFFTFFLGGVGVFDGGRKIGAVGVSGLPGEVDEQLAIGAIEKTAAP